MDGFSELVNKLNSQHEFATKNHEVNHMRKDIFKIKIRACFPFQYLSCSLCIIWCQIKLTIYLLYILLFWSEYRDFKRDTNSIIQILDKLCRESQCDSKRGNISVGYRLFNFWLWACHFSPLCFMEDGIPKI